MYVCMPNVYVSRSLFRMRLSHSGLAPGRPIAFTFDGCRIQALADETIAAALAAAGEVGLRRHRDGSMRGLWCGMGACFDCIVTVDGRAGQRACLTKVEPGMVVTSSLPQRSSMAPLVDVPLAAAEETAVDVAIVGAGPAGLTIATHLASAGVTVLVIDERSDAGGQYFKPVARSHRETAGTLDRQFAQGASAPCRRAPSRRDDFLGCDRVVGFRPRRARGGSRRTPAHRSGAAARPRTGRL